MENDELNTHESMEDELKKIHPDTKDVATNTGTTIDTLDAAFHNALGMAKGNELTGSKRAAYYESNSYGKSDAEEELDAMNPSDEVLNDKKED